MTARELAPSEVLADLFGSDDWHGEMTAECAAGIVLQRLTDAGFEVKSAWPPAGGQIFPAGILEALYPLAQLSLWRDVYPDGQDMLTETRLQRYFTADQVRAARVAFAAQMAAAPLLLLHSAVADRRIVGVVSRIPRTEHLFP
jgi:hypothetical protein